MEKQRSEIAGDRTWGRAARGAKTSIIYWRMAGKKRTAQPSLRALGVVGENGVELG